LGIAKAKFEFIAFLDADDCYLPNRFDDDKLIFQDPNVFVSYSLSSIQYPDAKEEWFGTRIDLKSKFPNAYQEEIYQYNLLGQQDRSTDLAIRSKAYISWQRMATKILEILRSKHATFIRQSRKIMPNRTLPQQK
jgi:hypothetical protein